MKEQDPSNNDQWVQEQQRLISDHTPEGFIFMSTITRSYIDAYETSGMELLHLYESHPETYRVVTVNKNTLQELNLVYRKMNILDITAQALRTMWSRRS